MKNGTPVVLCIGSDKILGDSIGPTVGDILKCRLNAKCFVYGCTGKSVNGKNLDSFVKTVRHAHPDSPIIAVDACLSNAHESGHVEITATGVNPKRALTKRINPVGDVGILGIIDRPSDDPLSTLMTVPWDNVEKISNKIAIVIYKTLFCD